MSNETKRVNLSAQISKLRAQIADLHAKAEDLENVFPPDTKALRRNFDTIYHKANKVAALEMELNSIHL